jgi:hypothetical protein
MKPRLITGVSLAACLIALAGCSRKSDQLVPTSQDPGAALRAAPEAADPLAAAKDPANPGPAIALSQADQDRVDNARSASLAPQLVSHPEWLARQEALCGPNNFTLQTRIAAAPRPLPPDLRDLKVACIAKDIAKSDLAANPHVAPGVQNTNSL